MAEETEQREETEGSSEKDEKAQREERMRELEKDPPKDLKDWPDDELKYETFGGPEGDHSYEEGPEAKLGPSGLRHLPEGEVEIEGEKVDNPDEYKGDPIPGGPTDPNATGPDVDNDADDDDEDGGDGEGKDRKGDADESEEDVAARGGNGKAAADDDE